MKRLAVKLQQCEGLRLPSRIPPKLLHHLSYVQINERMMASWQLLFILHSSNYRASKRWNKVSMSCPYLHIQWQQAWPLAVARCRSLSHDKTSRAAKEDSGLEHAQSVHELVAAAEVKSRIRDVESPAQVSWYVMLRLLGKTANFFVLSANWRPTWCEPDKTRFTLVWLVMHAKTGIRTRPLPCPRPAKRKSKACAGWLVNACRNKFQLYSLSHVEWFVWHNVTRNDSRFFVSSINPNNKISCPFDSTCISSSRNNKIQYRCRA